MIDQRKIKEIDKQDVYSSIKYLPDQINQVISDIEKIKFPKNYQNANLIVISGMGGSIFSYYVLESLFQDNLRAPLFKINSYHLPKSVKKNKTLFIASSYSGTTEETVSTTVQAIKEKNLVTGVTLGGKLGELMKKNHLPFYQFEPKFNPCGQPRIGLGYTIFGSILILSTLNYLEFNINDLKKALLLLKKTDQLIQEKASSLITKIKEKIVILIASEHLAGNVHIARNQLNETAKSFAQYHLIPELNHHLMEGLTYPKDKNIIFIFYNSNFYDKRNISRIEVTKRVLKKQKIDYLDVSFEIRNKLEEFLFYLQFGSYLSFFLAIDYQVNPSLIPWVDYFKKQLKKMNKNRS